MNRGATLFLLLLTYAKNYYLMKLDINSICQKLYQEVLICQEETERVRWDKVQ